jgi:hypothetical protein
VKEEAEKKAKIIKFSLKTTTTTTHTQLIIEV